MISKDYPVAAKHPEVWDCGGHSIEDPYLYMKDAGSSEVLDWVQAENEYTGRWFQDKGVEERIRFLKEKKEKWGRPSYSNIIEENGMLYASQRSACCETAAVLLDKNFEEVRLLLDKTMMDGRMQIYGAVPCPGEGRLAAFSGLKNGAPRPTVIIRDIEKNENLAELDGTFSFTWSRDGRYLYSTTVEQRTDDTTANSVIRWRKDNGAVETLYTWPKHAVFLTLAAAPNGGLFVHVCLNYHDNAVMYLDEEGEAIQVFPDSGASITYVGTIGSRHYFQTDKDAPLSKVVAVEHAALGQEAEVVIPTCEKPLEQVMVVDGKLMLNYLRDAACVVSMWDSSGKFLYEVALPSEAGRVFFPPVQNTWNAGPILLGFCSFNCPESQLRFDPATGETALVYSVGEGPRTDLVVERRFVAARDGQQVFAFLVYKKGLTPTGKVPTLMYGYGGYGSNQLPWYNNPFVGMDIPDWTDRGGLYVHCIIRGGGEYGSAWHEAGCKLNKKNVFYDFIDIARQIMADGWTDPAHTAICGGSNGGLLVTALLTIEPELWGCAIASVPHTDMLHFCRDDRGPMYVTEYGDPRDADTFAYMRSYSPYHNIREGVRYPATYVQTGELDNNVPPYHGKKFAAALQQATVGGPVLLRVLPFGSHDRGSGEYFYRTAAETQCFIELVLGMVQ